MDNLDFEYAGIDVNYSSQYDCEKYGCNNEGICRCKIIDNISLGVIDIPKAISFIWKFFHPELEDYKKRQMKISDVLYGGDPDYYCIDRIFRHYKLYDIGSYHGVVDHGYYGDQFAGVFIKNGGIENGFQQDCEVIFSTNSLATKLRHVIYLEYGMILECLKKADFEIITMTKDDLNIPNINQSHVDNILAMGELDYYSDDNYQLPRGIVKRHGDKFDIIDGYHRILNAQKEFNVFCIK
jgi:hypothetical protein